MYSTYLYFEVFLEYHHLVGFELPNESAEEFVRKAIHYRPQLYEYEFQFERLQDLHFGEKKFDELRIQEVKDYINIANENEAKIERVSKTMNKILGFLI